MVGSHNLGFRCKGDSMRRVAPISLDLRTIAGNLVAPVVGMAFFWAYFRYQIVFTVLYPQNSTVALGPATIPTHGAFLLSLTLLACLALAWRPPKRVTRLHLVACAALESLGTLGGLLALAAQTAATSAHTALVWLSALLSSGGFLVAFLSWGARLSEGFCTSRLVVLSASYLLSLVAFRPHTGIPHEAFALAVPLGSSLCWLASTLLYRTSEIAVRPTNLRTLLNPSVWLFAAFLLAGSVIRGVADSMAADADPRRALSVPITTLFTVVCVGYWLLTRRSGQANALPFVLSCWINFAALFFGGVFVFIMLGDLSLGSSLVVIARSMLEIVLWMFLCDYAHRHHAPVVPLFITGGVLVEAASWAISYVLVPSLAPWASEGLASPRALTLIAIFCLIAVITVVCGVLLMLQSIRQARENPAVPDRTFPADSGGQSLTTLERIPGLSPRETNVTLLYAHGYSLSKVAEELGITTGSAQTSIKSVYRKLGVHSKNELISAVEELREE